MDDSYCVYSHTNIKNGKKYFGITSQLPKRRWNNGRGYMNNRYFYRAILEYGWDGFSHEILFDRLSKQDAEEKEIELIRLYRTNDNRYGYNIESGGNARGKTSESTKEMLKAINLGRKRSAETRKRISESKKGHKPWCAGKRMSQEIIEKNRAGHLGLPAWNKGRPWTPDERAKCGGKAVLCVETGVTYRTAHEASALLGIDFSSICKCRRGKAKTAGGFHWKPIAESEMISNG